MGNQKTGWDMDGVFAFDLDNEMYKNYLQEALEIRDGMPPTPYAPSPEPRDVIITGRPQVDSERTYAWLRKNGFDIAVYFRPDDVEHGKLNVAMHKATTASSLCCTRFVESDVKQAVMIAELAPDIEVIWYNEGNPIRIEATRISM